MATLVRLVLLVVGAMTLSAIAASVALAGPVSVMINPDAAPRVVFGAERLVRTLEQAGIESRLVRANEAVGVDRRIEVHVARDPQQNPEGFSISSTDKDVIVITGGGDSGALYGCLELADRVRKQGRLPEQIDFTDAPAFKLRGPCIGMQKTFILPGRKVYEYPYTPELFPFFYDKAYWTEYLDFLVGNRMNSLYLWNGQPFASLVKVPGYEYAQEVDDATFAQNQQMMRWLAQECDRRGIWLVQMFYSIILPKPLAEKHGLDTQLKAPHPVATDYMRKAVAEFVKT
jgi:hypothetical protein